MIGDLNKFICIFGRSGSRIHRGLDWAANPDSIRVKGKAESRGLVSRIGHFADNRSTIASLWVGLNADGESELIPAVADGDVCAFVTGLGIGNVPILSVVFRRESVSDGVLIKGVAFDQHFDKFGVKLGEEAHNHFAKICAGFLRRCAHRHVTACTLGAVGIAGSGNGSTAC